MQRQASRFRRDAEGGVLVEFTLIAPFLMVIGLGAIEFGNALYGYQQMTTGVKDAARYLARLNDPNSAVATAQTLAVTGQVGGSTNRLSWWNSSDVAVTFTTIDNPVDPNTGAQAYRGREQLLIVRVASTATYPGFGMLNYLGLGSSLTLRVHHEERVVHQ